MKLFLDSNIIVDALRFRESQAESARLLVGLGRIGEFDLWVSPTQASDLAYILSEGGKRSRMRDVAREMVALSEAVHICPCGESEILAGLKSDWPDLEDAFVYEAARAMKADVIITRNRKDFEQSKIPVYDCEEFFEWYAKEYSINYAEIAY